MYQTGETKNKIYPIGNTGFYVNPDQSLNAVRDWMNKTPTDTKIKQMKQAAVIGSIVSVIVLIISIILQMVL